MNRFIKGSNSELKLLKKPSIVISYGIGENALGIIRSLGRKNIPVILIVLKGYFNVSVFSKYINVIIQLEECTRDSILNEIIRLSEDINGKPILFIDNCKMVNMLHKDKKLLEKHVYITQGIGDYTDKIFQFEAAENANVAVPKTWKPKSWSEYAEEIVTDKKLIAKPDFTSGIKPFKLLIAGNKELLRKQIEQRIDSPDGILIQEYIDGSQSNIWVSLGYRSSRTNDFYCMSAIKHTMFPTYGGVMAIGKTIFAEDVIRLTEKIARELNYYGIFGFEFKYSQDENKYYYIEMSPRTEGFHNITRLVGLDLPMMAYHDLVLEQDPDIISEKKYLQKYWTNIRYLTESLITSRKLSEVFRIIIPLLKTKQWQHFSWDDMRPALYANTWYAKKWHNKILKKLNINK